MLVQLEGPVCVSYGFLRSLQAGMDPPALTWSGICSALCTAARPRLPASQRCQSSLWQPAARHPPHHLHAARSHLVNALRRLERDGKVPLLESGKLSSRLPQRHQPRPSAWRVGPQSHLSLLCLLFTYDLRSLSPWFTAALRDLSTNIAWEYGSCEKKGPDFWGLLCLWAS